MTDKQGAIIEAREALEKIINALPSTDEDYYDGWTYQYRLIAEQALERLDNEVINAVPDKQDDDYVHEGVHNQRVAKILNEGLKECK